MQEQALVPAADGSQLALAEVRVTAGGAQTVGEAGKDTLLFCVGGDAVLECGAEREELHPGAAAIVRAGEAGELTAADSARLLLLTIGTGADEHAPMGADARVVVVDRGADDTATGKRAFQVLFGAENGSRYATLFVGYVPPGKAPWHFHQYDEIVWIWQGHARYHFGDTTLELEPGSAFRIRPRDVHVLENLSEADELVLLGLFTPAGSPSAAYLAPQG